MEEINEKIKSNKYISNELCEYIVFEFMVNQQISYNEIVKLLDDDFYISNKNMFNLKTLKYIFYINIEIDDNLCKDLKFIKINFLKSIKYIEDKQININNLSLCEKLSIYDNNIIIKILKDYNIYEYKSYIDSYLKIYYKYIHIDIYLYLLDIDYDVSMVNIYNILNSIKDIHIIEKYDLLNKLSLDENIYEDIINNNNIILLEYLYNHGYNVRYNKDYIECSYNTLKFLNLDNDVELINKIVFQNNSFIIDLINNDYQYLNQIEYVKFNIYYNMLTFKIINSLNDNLAINNIYIYDKKDLENKYEELLYCKENNVGKLVFYSDVIDYILYNNMVKYFIFLDGDYILKSIFNIKSLYIYLLYLCQRENQITCSLTNIGKCKFLSEDLNKLEFYIQSLFKNDKIIWIGELILYTSNNIHKLIADILDNIGINFIKIE